MRRPHSFRYSSISRSSEFHRLPVVAGILNDHLVGSDRLHGVIQAVAGAARLALNAINGCGWTTARADHGLPFTVGIEATTCNC